MTTQGMPPLQGLSEIDIISFCSGMDVALTEDAARKLAIYLALLAKWNKVMNLVGPYEPFEMLSTLLVDSFYLSSFLQSLPLPPSPECWDLGAGAGLPGIPLRCVWEAGTYTLVEAREKRSLFLQTVLATCVLPQTYVFNGRVESFMPGRPSADLITSRAFMPWKRLLELVKNYIAPDGICVFLTLEPAPEALPKGWELVSQEDYMVHGSTRYLWAFSRVDSHAVSGAAI